MTTTMPAPLSDEERTALIDRYAAGGRLLRQAIQGVGATERRAHPVPGKWSIQQLGLHLCDAELVYTTRMRRVIAEPLPLLMNFDEMAFLDRLGYEEADLDVAAELIDLLRRQTASLLRRLPGEAFAHTGVHRETGIVTLERLVHIATAHMEHHDRFLRDKLRALGRG